VNPYWWLQLATGILLVLLAFWVSGSDRVYALAQRTYLILFWVGFLALFRGFSQLILAFTVRHAGQEAGMSTTEDGSGGASRRVQQAPGLWRTDLQQQDLSVPGREVIQARVDLGPTAPLVKHTHPAKRSSTSWKGRWSTRSTAS
jgi:hypothetical protein